MKIQPLPSYIGTGFSSTEPLELSGYTYENKNNFHNYLFNFENWKWPDIYSPKIPKVIDGFSPNLNKVLHSGHLKNLAVAAALSNILGGNPVAMLGASLGVNPDALEIYDSWCKLANYTPNKFLDTELPKPSVKLEHGEDKYEGCMLYNNVVIYKSNGKPTYAAHDLSFQEVAKPDFYLTGAEQKEHFASLGLGDKHLPLGLLLGSDGKKMKSTVKKESDEENALSAKELFELVIDCLNPETKEKEFLAWNILAWQFNSSQVSGSTKFNAKVWAKPESSGLYITYTYARINKALKKCGQINKVPFSSSEEVELVGLSQYFDYYINKAYLECQPNNIANFALTLAKKLSSGYKSQSISEGSLSWQYANYIAVQTLGKCMKILGMHCLEEV